MSHLPKILALAGSARKDSFNKKFIHYAIKGAKKEGADVQLIDMAAFPLPLYDGDLEEREGLPLQAKKLKKEFIQADGFIFCCPEYNSSLAAPFKNLIDWVSRPEPGEKNLIAFQGKTAAIMSASPGALGGLRGLYALRMLLSNMGVIVLPEHVTLPSAHTAFDTQNGLLDEKKANEAERHGERLALLLKKLS